MAYGIKVYDASGNSSFITTNISSIIASGTLTMSDFLNADDTYGEDISLWGTYERDEIGVIAYPTKFTYKAAIVTVGDPSGTDDDYPFSWYADSNATYYTRDSSTGVMSVWNAGDLSPAVADEWDAVASVFPYASWNYLDSETTFDNVRIWAVMAHIIYDASDSNAKAVYTIGSSGVEEVDYMVFLKGT